MTTETLTNLIFTAGWAQLSVLVASALVPIRLNWKEEFKSLSPLHRQMYWVYGGYVVLSIIALGVIAVVNSRELAGGGLLARSVCAYIATFWGIRVSLQPILRVKEHLKTWWLFAGYHLLTGFFLFFVGVFSWAAFRLT
ncbi:hypothetical protein [Anatilimnocola floriformis]|uniref:hypothetical protein n=1 Tax=Anatilimnocola floriformis TaxID=2948575 RepID=UPI0020C1C1CA|nr:hypothetical protein [Anatilimnocola floriformis]